MGEILNIGGRLHSTETGNVVAGANEIFDDDKGKKQSQINAETDETLAAHSSAISGFDSGNFITLVATDADTDIAAVFTRLGVTPAVNTIYRIANWKHDATTKYNTAYYSEYSANGTTIADLVPITVENKGIADATDFDEPDNSKRDKLPTVGAVADVFGYYTENPEFIYVKLDAQKRILWAINRKDGTVHFGAGVPPQIVDYIQQKIDELFEDLRKSRNK